MTSLKSVVIYMFVTLLCCCATPYKRNSWLEEWPGGFATTRINDNTYIITFRGNYFTPYQKAQNDAMYRAAQVTIDAGYDYFVVTNSSTMPPENNLESSYKVPFVNQKESHTAVIAIKTYNGSVPAGLPNAYDAKEIITHVEPTAN